MVYSIYEGPDFKELFLKHQIMEVPTAIILNTNLTSLRILENISPADILLEVENLQSVFESNKQLEADKYQKKCLVFDNQDVVVVFKFAEGINEDFPEFLSFLDHKKLSFRELTCNHFSEQNPFVIQANICAQLG